MYIGICCISAYYLAKNLLECKSVLEKANMQQKDKEKWLKVLKVDLTSSEESENDDVMVKPLEWQSGIVKQISSKVR